MYGESLLSGQVTNAEDTPISGDFDASEESDPLHEGHGRATRSGGRGAAPLNGSRKRKHTDTYDSLDGMSDEDDAASSANDWDGGDDEEVEDNLADDDEDEMSLDEDDTDDVHQSLIVKLKLGKQPTPQNTVNTLTSTTRPEPPQVEEKKEPTEMLAQLPAMSHHAETKSANDGASVASVVPGASDIVTSASETTLEKPVSGEHPTAFDAPKPQPAALNNPVADDIEYRGHVPAPTTTKYAPYVPPSIPAAGAD